MSADGIIARRPWLLVVGAFVVLILLWIVFLNIAFRYKPDEVPMETPAPAKHPMGEKGGSDGR